MSTNGQDFAKTIRSYFHIGPRTRNYRAGMNLKREILDAIEINNQFPGYYNEAQTKAIAPAYAVRNAYAKHIEGGRVDGLVCYEIEKMSPYQFAGFLGDMIDAGVTNCYEGEMFFQQMHKDIYDKAA